MDEEIAEKDKASILARKVKKKKTCLGFWLGFLTTAIYIYSLFTFVVFVVLSQ